MIGRFLAACEISMSDFGDWCCEAGMTGFHSMKGRWWEAGAGNFSGC
jgi:hypothetical protein